MRAAVAAAAGCLLWAGGPFLAWPGAMAAQEPPPRQEGPTVRVTASGTVEASPDRVVLGFGVETFADSADAASAENAARAARVLARLKALGIPEERLRTVGYALEPEYEREGPDGRGPRRIARYRAWNVVQATVDSIGRAGEVIDAAIAAGANHVTGVSFGLRDREAAEREALAAAVEAARARAETLAGAAGMRLGPILDLSTGDIAIPRFGVAPEAMQLRAATPIEPGTLSVSGTVTVVWRLEPAEDP